MRVSQFDYELPTELIAEEPAPARDGARLMVVPAGAEARHAEVRGLDALVAPGTLVVVNDTRVLRARVLGVKEGTGGKAEVFLVRKLADAPADAQRWRAMTRASKGLRPGARVLKGALVVEVEGRADDGLFDVRLFTRDGSPVGAALDAAGQIPLPPYIKREVRPEDEER